jgi:hypothetical protein
VIPAVSCSYVVNAEQTLLQTLVLSLDTYSSSNSSATATAAAAAAVEEQDACAEDLSAPVPANKRRRRPVQEMIQVTLPSLFN